LEEKMKNLRNALLLSLTMAAFLLAGTAAKADPLTITFAAPFQSGLGGDVLAFDATVTNTSGDAVYLNGDDFNLGAPLILDDSPFYLYPLTLGAGDSYTGLLFNVDMPSGTPVGVYPGSFEITGGSDGSAQDVVGEADFDVYVTPEPSSFLLLGTGLITGLAGLGGNFLRRLIG
jgi:hypothetical protein